MRVREHTSRGMRATTGQATFGRRVLGRVMGSTLGSTLGWCALGLGLLLCPLEASAEVRQYLIASDEADADRVVQDLTTAMQDAGFQVTPMSDQTRSTGGVGGNGAVTFRYVEYAFMHVDGTSITATFLLLSSPDADALEALQNYASVNYSWSMLKPMGKIGLLGWAEYSPMGGAGTVTLDTVLVEWRETYL